MTDHLHGEDSYIECDYYTVVSQIRQDEKWDDWNGETSCYCGADSVYVARVGFHTRLEDDSAWPRTFSQDLKVHRCEEHKFQLKNEK